ncbi:choline dehydrogenase [Nannochloropsis oceanica]
MASSTRCFGDAAAALLLCVFFLGSTTAGLFGPAQPADEYDYIVVGAGACGAVLATRLAERGQKILLLETGEDEHLNPLTRWGYFFPSGAYSHLYRNYFTEPEPHVNNRRLYHQAAKALGGGTAVNAMVWTWGDRKDWELIDLEGWSFEDVYPYFLKSENYTGGPSSFRHSLSRGHDGPITLTSFVPNAATTKAVETAASTFDVPVEVDNNGGQHESAAVVQRDFKGATIDTGMRMGTFMAYLRPALASFPPEQMNVLTRATVLKVLVGEVQMKEGGGTELEALGVRYLHDGVCHEAFAKKEVLLAAGAYNSPKLLLLSGIGDKSHLDEVGIDCILDLPGVGKNLVDHINPGSLLFTGPPRKDYDANIVAAYTRTGVVGDLTPDVELGFIMGPPVEDPALWGSVPSLYVFYALWLLHDGEGSVTLKNKDPLEDPIIVSGYLRTPTDLKRLVRIFRMLVEWAGEFSRKSGLRLEQQGSGGNAIMVTTKSTDEEILKAARTVLSTHWHAAQSCRMGDASKDPAVVVDTKFKVVGIDKLRVIDASSQPVLTNGHPMAALVMMAERAVDFMLGGKEEVKGRVVERKKKEGRGKE